MPRISDLTVYAAMGWALVRIPPLAKAPADRGWPDTVYQPSDFSDSDNVGVKLGDPSRGLVDIDLDCPEAIQCAPNFLPPTATFGRASAPRAHWIYTCPEAQTRKPRRAQVELRSTGVQTVFPGSIHPSGEPIVWCDWPADGPAVVAEEELVSSFYRLAMGAALLRLLPSIRDARCTHDFVMALSGALRRSGWPKEATLHLIDGSIGTAAMHRAAAVRDTYNRKSHDPKTGWPTVEQLIGPLDAKLLQRLAEDPIHGYIRPTSSIAVQDVSGHLTNDDGNADLLLEKFGANLRYADGIGWLRWVGSHWHPSDGPWPEASFCARELHDQGQAMGGPTGQALAQWGRMSGNASRMRAAIEVASHRPAVRVEPGELDADPWLLNVQNGTIDLRTGELRDHNRDDLITKICPIPYDPRTPAPRFEQFLIETMDGDVELVAYMLRFLGYALTGKSTEHVFGLWHGPKGRNGKSVLLHLLQYVLGGYATTIAPDLLLQTAGNQHPTGLMDLRGCRLAVTNEAPEGRRWNESLVKQLTGGDKIKARAMRQDFVEFDPTHTIIMATNARPLVREQGPAFWARVSMIPWVVSFRGREDRDLPRKLEAEAVGVLRYLVAGCLAWQAQGLAPPSAVVRAGEDYRESQDTIGVFISDCLEPSPKDAVSKKHVYNRFRAWAEDNGEPYIPSATAFYRQLDERGKFHQTKSGGERKFAGWRLKEFAGV